jgi:NADH:ubiquinone oxidoreductase subunit 6 (subunit J)
VSEQVFIPVISERTFHVKEIAYMLISYGKNGYALPFEVISLLLLAAIVASSIMAKKEKYKS